ncbi:hypothetical protein U1Q18_036688 [Sarracenia purpurea var. burkii]
MCNKLASRHVWVGLVDPRDVPRCDICENAPGDKPSRLDELGLQPVLDTNTDGGGKMDNKMFDLNAKPQRVHGQASNNQEQGMDALSGANHSSSHVAPVKTFKREHEK